MKHRCRNRRRAQQSGEFFQFLGTERLGESAVRPCVDGPDLEICRRQDLGDQAADIVVILHDKAAGIPALAVVMCARRSLAQGVDHGCGYVVQL